MEITHEEARRLIQHNADEALNQNKQIMLRAHLKDCADCRVYAAELNEIENTLRPVMQRQWDLRPTPLLMNVLPLKRKFKEKVSIILAIRTALAGLAIVAFIFSVWQFKLTNSATLSQTPLSILPVPTPSAQLTSTRIVSQNCEEIRYKVQENDTLESVADGFSTSKESIMIANEMKTEAIIPAMELIIPICHSTPTGTVNPPTHTTHTPSTNPGTTTSNG